jgi:hypothetical protein
MGMYGSAPKHLYRAPAKPQHKSGGLLHILGGPATFAGHLAEDIGHTAMGLGPGLLQTFKHPIGSIEEMGKSSWQDWSPLFHGHVGKWAHNFYSHPLAPILDVAAVAGIVAMPFTAGASGSLDVLDASFRGASLASKAGRAAKATQLEMKTADGVTVTRQLRRAPLASMRQVALHELATKSEAYLPKWFTPTAKADRILARQVMRNRVALHNQLDKEVAYHAQVAALVAAGEKLGSVSERTAILQHNYDQFRRFAHKWDGPKIDEYRAGKRIAPPEGFDFVRETPKDLTSHVKTVEDYPGELERAHHRMMTDDGRLAAKEDGKYLVVPSHTAKNMMTEASHGASSLLRIVTTPWKLVQVGWAPRSLMNNSVGNVAMTIAEHRPVALAQGMLDAFRQSGNRKAAMGLITHGTDALNWHGIESHFHDVMDSPSAFDNPLSRMGDTKGIKGKVKSGFYPLIHKQEQFLKLVSLNAHLRGSAEVKSAMKAGASYEEAASTALTASPALRNAAAKRAFDTMGDYRTFNKFERGAREIMPFYSWNKHITLHTASMLDEHPVRLALMGQMGQEGKDTVERIIGKVPTYMEGVIPLSMLGLGKGKVLGTHGMNPYSTIGDISGLVRGLTVGGSSHAGQDIASGVNPFVVSAMEHITGQRIGTDIPVNTKGGLVPSTLTDVLSKVSEMKLATTLIQGEAQPHPNARTGKTTPFLYRKDAKSQALGLLGLPVKDVNVSRAHELANKELGVKRRKRRRKVHHGLF